MISLRLAAAILGVVSAAAGAQVAGSPPAKQGSVTFGIGSSGAFLGVPRTGAPYCAQETSEHTQTLADGTHIVRKSEPWLLCHDSQGRTRTEHRAAWDENGNPEGPIIVEIRDPVAGFQYTLDPPNRIAHRLAASTALGGRVRMNAAGSGGILTAPPAVAPPPPPPRPAPPVAARSSQIADAPAENDLRANRLEQSVESLGTQTMEGVAVEGNRVTTTIPAGAQGNDKPIVSVHETWTSTALGVTVLMKDSDPRNGESVTRLTNIVVGEPDPMLFQPPPDYTILDEKGAFTIHYTVPR